MSRERRVQLQGSEGLSEQPCLVQEGQGHRLPGPPALLQPPQSSQQLCHPPPAAPSPAPVCVSTRQPLFVLPQAKAALLQHKQLQVPLQKRRLHRAGISFQRFCFQQPGSPRLSTAPFEPLESGLRSTNPGCHIAHVEHKSLPMWLLLPPGRALCDPNLDVPHTSSPLYFVSLLPESCLG